jgi:hypothetical protein
MPGQSRIEAHVRAAACYYSGDRKEVLNKEALVRK